jgi:hypothetical protein
VEEEARHVERLSMSDWALAEAAAEVLHGVLWEVEVACPGESSATLLK